MSWLHPVQQVEDVGEPVSAGTWLRERLWVRRDLETAQLVVDEAADGVWVHAWADRDHLVAAAGDHPDEVDAAEMRGEQVRRWLRADAERGHIGVMLHPDAVTELVVLRPQVTPVHRVAVE